MKTTNIASRQIKYNGYLKIEELAVLTKAGEEIKREVLKKQNAVAALVYNTITRMYIFARQWRPGPESDIIEIPAGVLDKPGETPEDCIAREIKEEVGYAVDTVSLIAKGFVSPGASSEMISIYFARVSHQVSAGGGVSGENEEIEIVQLNHEEMLATVFNDLKSIIAVQWAKYNNEEL